MRMQCVPGLPFPSPRRPGDEARSPRSATRRFRLRTACQLTPTRRWWTRHRSTPKGSRETVTLPARRYLELTEFDPASRAQLLVAGDVQLYEESISITTIQSFLGNRS